MNQTGFVELDQNAHQLLEQRDRFLLRQRTAFESSRQRFTIQQLHDQERMTLVLRHLVELASIWMRKRGCGASLVKKAIARLGVIEILADQLDGNATAQLQIQGLEHTTHAAFAERALDAIP